MSNRARVEDLVASLRGGSAGEGVEKTAEALTLARLSRNSQVKVASAEDLADVDLDALSFEELLALSREVLGSGGTAQVPAPTEKTAAEIEETSHLLKVSAHAFQQELDLIKQANALGYCRFCKENPATPGTSICSACQEG